MSFFSRRRDLDASPSSSGSTSSLRKRVSIFTSRLVRPQSNYPSYTWTPRSRSPSRSPSPPSPDIRRPSGLGRRASLISLPLASPSPASPTFLARGRTLSTPQLANFPVPPAPRVHPAIVLALPYVSRDALTAFARVSRAARATAVPLLYGKLDLDEYVADECIATIAANPPLAGQVTAFSLSSSPASATFALALSLALRSMHHLTSLTLPYFSSDLLANLPYPLRALRLLSTALPPTFYTTYLPSQPALRHLALPNLVSPATPVSTDLESLCGSPALAMALAPHCKLREMELYVNSTLYDGLRPAALMDALAGVRTLRMVLGHNVDARTRARLVGALGHVGQQLELLELRMEGSDEVQQVSSHPKPRLADKDTDPAQANLCPASPHTRTPHPSFCLQPPVRRVP
ncbi:hypothetical protein FA95DRAFT_1162552 [Auriscalpium vulgare]|uniref:Uncharacterized protein n=1 Tax=Auriscalpium vulgare TaxID=40419 RepID=A0ACB8S8F8_9AGAM|nr:hypothetical protein FA95DRAFT_1162552 [Auriscalpium vulgare]